MKKPMFGWKSQNAQAYILYVLMLNYTQASEEQKPIPLHQIKREAKRSRSFHHRFGTWRVNQAGIPMEEGRPL